MIEAQMLVIALASVAIAAVLVFMFGGRRKQ